MTPDEKELVVRASNGDKDALNELIHLYYERLVGVASYYVDSFDDILDIVQDSFVDMLRRRDSLDCIHDIGAWLRTICRNRILMHYRAKSRRNSRLRLVDAVVADVLSDSVNADDGNSRDEMDRLAALRRCVEKLHPEQNALIRMRYFDGMAIKDIAEKLGRKANSVTKTIGRIHDALYGCIKSAIG
ncbi:MAG: sigma-70 family RNA polymerase sigma factor [Planctomycetota bacterium]